jgi:hypothetical protein
VLWAKILSISIFEATKEVPTPVILVIWVLTTVLFAATLVGYLMDNRQTRASMKVAYFRILVGSGYFVFRGARAGELCLAIVPLATSFEVVLAISFEMGSSCIWKIKDRVDGSECAILEAEQWHNHS